MLLESRLGFTLTRTGTFYLHATASNGASGVGGPYRVVEKTYTGGSGGSGNNSTTESSTDYVKPTISLDGITASGGEPTITGSNVTKADYGGVVTNYNPTNGVDVNWQIYHTDGTNIYLIADDYIPNSYVPNGKNGVAPTKSGSYAISFNESLVSGYAGLSDIPSDIKNKWFTLFESSTLVNAKATAYLLDTSVWNGFEDGTYTEYAVGAPPMEMFIDSYNAYRGYSLQLYVPTYYDQLYGYGLYIDEGAGAIGNYWLSGIPFGLYAIKATDKAKGAWIGSPHYNVNTADYPNLCMWDIDNVNGGAYGRGFCMDVYEDPLGIRPVVCLKEGVTVSKQSDGTYLLVGEDDGEDSVEDGAIGNQTWKQSHSVPIKIEDTGSGLASGMSIQYAWSTSNTTTPTSWSTLTIPSYTAGAKSVETTITGSGYTGKYYLWVKPVTVKDVVGNTNDTVITTGEYWFDNTAPTGTTSVSATITNQSTITVYVTGVSDGHSGINYVNISGWFGTTWVSKNNSVRSSYDSTNNRYYYTFNFSDIVDTSDGSTNNGDGTYSFDANVYDKAGNRYNTNNVSVIYDTTKPTATGITLSATYTQTGQITATANGVTDNLSGVSKVQWYLTNSSGYVWANVGSDSQWNKSIDVSSLAEGWYNVAIVVYDAAGNVNDTTLSSSPSYIGWKSFCYDKTAPTITLSANSNTTYQKTHSVTVTLADSLSGLASGASVKYGWSTSNTTAPSTYTTASLSYTAGATSTTFTATTPTGLATGQYYLWVVPTTLKDLAGNSNTTTVKSTGKFYIDNTAPTGNNISVSASYTNQDTVTVYVTGVSDAHSGVYRVAIMGWFGSTWISFDNWEVGTYDSTNDRYYHTFTFSELKDTSDGSINNGDGSYTFDAHVYDNAGNMLNVPGACGVIYDTTPPEIYYSTDVITDGLIREVDGYNNTGNGHSSSTTTWTDLTGTNNGAITGGTWSNEYLALDGTDDWVNLGEVSLPNNQVTLEATIVPNGTSGNILANYEGAGGTGLYLYNGRPVFDVYIADTGFTTIESSTALTTGQKYHLTGTFDGTTVKLYVDGEVVASTTVSGTMGATTNNTVMAIGANPSGSAASSSGIFANINVYAARVYDKALTQTQIAHNIEVTNNTVSITDADQTWSKTHDVTVTLADSLSGLATGAVVKYGWSTSRTTAPSSYTTASLSYTAGATSATFTPVAPSGTGKYYLWVQSTTLKDRATNSYTTTVVSTESFWFDNTPPQISIQENGSETWKKSHNMSGTISDAHSGLATGANLTYGWSTSNTTAPAFNSTATIASYTSGAKNATFSGSQSGLTGIYYLWVKPDPLQDVAGNSQTANKVSTDVYYFDNEKPKWEVQNISKNTDTKTVTLDLIGTDAQKYVSNSLDAGDIKVYVDGFEVNTITKTLSTETAVTNGVKYTLTLSNIEEAARQLGKLYKEWSGTITIKVAANTIIDEAENVNDETEFDLGHTDFIKPEITYVYSEADINRTDKTVTVVFSVTDKYIAESTLTSDDLTILVDGELPGDTNGNGVIDGTETFALTKTLTSEEITEERNGETVRIGLTYTLILGEFEQDAIASGKKYLDYSGVVTVGIPAGKILDTSDNANEAQTITVGIDVSSSSSSNIILPTTQETAPYIPEGYSYLDGNLDEGIVIKDANGNEFVWVEVPRTSTVYGTAGLNITSFTDAEFTKIENDLHTYTSVYRNGTTFTDTWSSLEATGLTENQYNTQKKKMLKSIYKNGGFYVGRYETGIEDSYRTATEDATQTPIIKQNAYPYNFVTYAQAQTLSSGFASDGYTSSLMFGVQWDLVMKYLESKGTTQAELITDSTSWGNYSNTIYSITNTNAKYTTDDGVTWSSAPYTHGRGTFALLTTGASDTFNKQNIYDLSGNLWEMTLENSNHATARGGVWYYAGSDRPVNYRSGEDTATSSHHGLGFRTALYKDEGTVADSATTEPTYIPEGYTHVSGTTMENGYVVADAKGNEYVWVEVPRTSTVYPTAGLSITSFTDAEYTKIENDLNTYTTTYGNSSYSDAYSSSLDQGLTENQYNTQKKKMLKSIYKNGGFYVGRYETGIEDSWRTAAGDATQTPVIKQNAYPYNYVTVAQRQELATRFISDGYSTSMLFNVQYKLILKYLETNGTEQAELITDSTSWGNYKNSTYMITNENAKYSLYDGDDADATWTSAPYNKTSTDTSVRLTTGASETFKKQNIYDLAGNSWESTLGINTAGTGENGAYAIYAGAAHITGTGFYAGRVYGGGGAADWMGGFRVALYKDEGTGSDSETEAPTYIPEGFTHIAGTTMENGYVVSDSNGNEYVWVEVPRTSAVYGTAGLNITSFTDAEYTKIENDLRTYTTDYAGGADTYISEEENGITEQEYYTQKKKMLKSIYKNGGFYVGRYETGIDYSEGPRTSIGNTTQTPVIKQNAYPYTYVLSSDATEVASRFTTTGYTSSLMFGVQWDLILKYLETKGTTQAELITDSTSWGNYNNNEFNVTNPNAKYTTDRGDTWTSAPYNKQESTLALLTTGASETFCRQNIYDLAGNAEEWTMSRRGGYVVLRGSGGYYSGNNRPASYIRTTDTPGNVWQGFRVTLYKDEGTDSDSETEAPTYIPEGYTHVAGTTMENGYVVADSKGNEYVWVEVPRTSAVYGTAGLNITSFTDAEYTKIENDLKTYTATYKNGAGYTDTWFSQEATGLTETQYNTQKKKMLKSIYKNGGFYVGRYETGIADSYRTAAGEATQTPVIKQNAYPYNWVTVSQSQALSSSFATDGYTSSLIFGVQWDLVMKYLETKGTSQEEILTDSTSWGNYRNNSYNITNTNAKYSTDTGATWSSQIPYNKASGTDTFLTTGASEAFSKQNISDLGGNAYEWTLASNSSGTLGAERGNYFGESGVEYSAAVYGYKDATTSSYFLGFRTALYKDEGTTADSSTTAPTYIPEGYTHVTGTTMENGYVVSDSKGNEYVWVEVPRTTTVYPTAGLNIISFTDAEYTKIENDLHTYTTTYRNGTAYTDTWSSEEATGLTEIEYNVQKKKMLKSIYKNGGFYVGRYETGINYSEGYRTGGNITQTPVIKQNAYPYNYVTASQSQALSSSFATTGYTSSLMFGVQRDLVLKYLETKGATVSELNSNSTEWGNYLNNTYNITNTNAQYGTGSGSSWSSAPYNKTSTTTAILLTTGASLEFSKQNIFDIAGNVREYTLENSATTSYPVVFQGGSYGYDGTRAASFRNIGAATTGYSDNGFRVALYKDEGIGGSQIVDFVSPSWTTAEIDLDSAGGSSQVRLQATDKYYYSSTLTEDDIEIYIGGVKSENISITLGTPVALMEDRDGDGTAETQYGVEYPLSFDLDSGNDYTEFTDTNTGVVSQYKESSSQVEIKILEGKIIDQYGNTSKEQTLDLGNLDTAKPEVIYDSSLTTVDPINNTITVIFDITDKFFSSSSLEASHITAKIGETTIDIDSDTLTSADLETTVDGTNRVVGKRYTLVLEPGEQTGIVTIEITAEKAIDYSGNTNATQTITIGIDMPELTGTATTIDLTNPTVTANPEKTTNAAGNDYVKSQNVTITVADDYSGIASSNSYQYFLSTSETALSGGSWTNYTSGTAFTIGTNLNGTYYLFVKTITDNDGNISTLNGTMTTIDGTDYHKFGPYKFDNTAPALTVSPTSSTWKNSAVSITATHNDTGGSGLASTSGSYFLSTSSSPTAVATGSSLSGTYTSGTAFSINPGTSGQYYLFVKEIADNATNKSSSTYYVTIDGVTYHRYGLYQFDYDLPVWSYVSKDIYYSTANDAGNDDYANKDRTVVITFKGTDVTSNITSTLTSDAIAVSVNGTAVPNSNKSLTTSSNNGTAKEVTCTLTITGITGDGTLDVVIPSGTLTDQATNTNVSTNITTSVDIEIDNTSPEISFAVTSPTAGYYKAGQVITITATYNEDIYKEITSNNLINTTAEAPAMTLKFGGATAKNTVTCTSVSGRVLTYSYTIKGPTTATGTDGDNGTLVISSLGTVYDRAGNSISASNVTPSVSIVADTIAPTVTSITANRTSPTNAESITYTVVFSENVTGFAASDVTVNSGKGTVTSVTGSGTTWTVVVSTTDNQEYTETITIKANGNAIDRVGNKVPAAKTSDGIVVDRIDPTVASITPNVTSPTNASSITYTVVFSENVTGFAAEDVTVNSGKGSVTSFSGSGTTYTVVVSTTDDVEYTETITIAAGKCIDKAGNGNVAATSTGLVVDRIDPTWTYVSKDIYYSTANDAGNDDYANADRTVVIVFKGTDANGHNVTSTLTSDAIPVKVNGTAVANTNKSLETSGNGTQEVTCTLTITGITGDGTLDVQIPSGSLTDQATNTNTLTNITTSVNITIDNTSPELSFAVTSPAAGYYKAGQVITITATYDEDVYKEVTSNNLIDTTAEAPTMTLKFGGATAKNTVSCTSVSGRVLTYTYTIKGPTTATGTDGDNGTLLISSLGTVYDRAGNSISASNVTPSVSIVADTTAPTVTSITPNVTSPTNASSITYTVVFSENVTGFAAEDVTVNSGKGSVTSVTGSGTTWSVVVSTTDDQEYTETITIKANGNAIDRAGNKVPVAKTSDGLVVDRIDPTVTSITPNKTSPTNASSITYTVVFSENVTGFAASDVTVNSGKGSVTSVTGSGTTWSVVVSTTDNQEYTETITIKANGATIDKAGNKVTTAKTSDGLVVDRIDPTVTSITANRTSPTNASSITYTVVFSENVTGFAASDVIVNSGKGSVTSVTGSGTTWTVVVSTTDDQEYTETITIKANGATIDKAGNKVTTAKTSDEIVVDRIDPTVTSITANRTSPTNASSITYTVVFSENVTGFVASDVTVNSGKGSVTSVTGSGTTWSVVVSTTDDQEYTETITIKANGATIDKAGNKVTTAKTSDGLVVDRIDPTVTSITPNVTSPTNASSITYTVVFSENVTGFVASDVTVNSGKGSVTSVSGSGTTWNVVVSTTDNQEYTETITIKANGATIDKAGNKVTTAKTSDGLVVDRIDPTWTYVSKDIYLNTANDAGNDDYANADRTVVIVFKGTDANGHNVTSTLTSDNIAVSVNGTPVADSNKSLETSGNGTQEVTCTLTITGITGDGTLDVQIPSGTLEDQATNTNTSTNITTSVNITIDNTSPELSFAVTSPATGYYKAGQVITITATYNDTNIGAGIFADQKSTIPITTANAPTMALAFGGTAAKNTVTCTSVSGRVLTYTYTIKGPTTTGGTDGDNGILKITSLGTVYDAAGNSVSASNVTPSPQITADTIAPTVTITANKTSYTNAANITYTFTFSENVTGFTADDVTVANGTKGTFTEVSGTVYTLVVSTIDDTVYTENVSLAADKCIDRAGNGNIASSTLSTQVDRKDPTITATPDKTTNATANNYVKSQSVTITVADEGAGLLASNSYQYFLSNSSTSLSGGTWTDYTSGTAFTIGTGLTGDYYLFVKTIKDNVTDTDKNVSSTQGDMTAISGYHMFGTYKFDNTSPYWEIGTPSIDYTNKKVTVDIIGTDDHSGYKANSLDTGDIEVWVEGTKITNVEKQLSTSTTVTEGIKYTLTLTDFEEDARQTGKNYKEWSGSTKIVIAANTLEDNLANKNTSQEFSLGQVDLIDPEFTYQYSETVIDKTNKKLTVVFYASDKYLDATNSGITLADFYNPNIDSASALTTKPVFAVDGEPININVTGNSLTPTTMDSGKTIKYTLVVANLQANPSVEEDNLNDGYTYSGIVSIAIPADKFKDTSDNGNEATTITVGTDDLDGEPNTGVVGGVIVDVVDPVWKLNYISLEDGIVRIQATDKYFDTCSIDEDDITVIVNGVTSTAIVKDITSTAVTNVYDTVNGVENTLIGKEYTLRLSNITPEDGGYKIFTPTNLSELDASTTDGSYQYKYRAENGGDIAIQIAAGTITDKSGNSSVQQKFDIGNIDITRPEVHLVRKTQNASANTETIVFNVTDRNYEPTDLVELNEITLWFDNVQLDTLRNNSTLTYKEIWGIPEGTTVSVRLGHQYTLVIPNIAETVKQSGKDYLEYSGTLKMTVAETAAKDFNLNNLNTSTTTITDFIDYVKPQVEQVTVTNPINTSNNTYTMSFNVSDKYLYDSDVADINMVTEDEITVYVDGEVASSITKSLTSTPITVTMNKTVNGTVTSGTYTIGHTYTLVLGGFEQSSKQEGKNFMEWSGTVTAVIAQSATNDTTGNTLDTDVTKRTLTGEHVDFIKPVLEEVSSTRGTNTETILFNIMDKYLADSNTNVLATSEITVYVDGEAVTVDYTDSSSTGLNGVLTKVQNFTATVNGDSTHVVGQQYQLVLSGFEQASRNAKGYKDYSGTVTMEIAQTAVADTKGNTLDSAVAKRTVTGDFVDFIKPDLQYTHSSSDINHGTKTYTMTFDVTDKYYDDEATNNVLTLDDLTITMQSEDTEVHDLKALALQGKVNIAFSDAEKSATFNKTVDGTVETTATSHVIGHTYTLTISNLDQLEIASGDTTVNYSGIITVVVAKDQIFDTGPAGDGTSPNKNVETEVVSGVNVPGGSGSGTVVDVVSPVFDKVSSSAYAFNPTNKASSIGTITFNATDRYFVEGSGITADDIQVVVNGNVVSTGITKTITATEELTEDRIISGTTQNDVQYGVQYTLEITGWAQNANQVKIRIPAEKLTDQYGNKNIQTDLIVYNCLELTSSEIASNSAFLDGNGLNETGATTGIQRQNIQQVIFTNSLSGSTATGVQKVWDVSAMTDGSIKAWTSQTSAPYTVYIGSNDEIFANQNSSYLFAHIGYGSNSTAIQTITNIDALNVRSVTNMASMFEGCGRTSMTTFSLGSNFNTSNVQNMSAMFKNFGQNNQTNLILGTQFITNEVTNMSSMFEGCGTTAMTSINLGSNFNTAKVTNMDSMFKNCAPKITSIDLGSQFDTRIVTDMGSMFEGFGTTSLTSLDLGNLFYTSEVTVTDMNNMFNGCGTTAMTVLDLGPAFTKISTSHTDFMKDCGTSTLIIYAPESIYSDRTSLKTN